MYESVYTPRLKAQSISCLYVLEYEETPEGLVKVTSEDFPDYYCYGSSRGEAMIEIRTRISDHLTDLLSEGKEIPYPKHPKYDAFEHKEAFSNDPFLFACSVQVSDLMLNLSNKFSVPVPALLLDATMFLVKYTQTLENNGDFWVSDPSSTHFKQLATAWGKQIKSEKSKKKKKE